MEVTIPSGDDSTGRIELNGTLMGIEFPAAMTETNIAVKPIWEPHEGTVAGKLSYDEAGALDAELCPAFVASGHYSFPTWKMRGIRFVEIVSCDAAGAQGNEAADRTYKLFIETL